jgi:hypothetical protein
VNRHTRHLGASAPAAAALLVGLLAASCTIGESGSDPLNHGPITPEYTGTWVVLYEPLESSCGDLEPRLETWRFLQDGPVEVAMYPDINENGLFDDDVVFTGQQDGMFLGLMGHYVDTEPDIESYFQANIEFITWGCLMGTVTQKLPNGCEETAKVTVARIANPPSIDINGVWHITHAITHGTGLLELSVGASFEEEWTIYQHMDGLWRGLLEITDSAGQKFLGTVNNNQVILVRSWISGEIDYRYHFTNLIFQDGWMSGDAFGSGVIEGSQEIGWDLSGWQEEVGTSGLMFDGGGGEQRVEPALIELFGERGERCTVSCPRGGDLRTRVTLAPGRWRVRCEELETFVELGGADWRGLSLRPSRGG